MLLMLLLLLFQGLGVGAVGFVLGPPQLFLQELDLRLRLLGLCHAFRLDRHECGLQIKQTLISRDQFTLQCRNLFL